MCSIAGRNDRFFRGVGAGLLQHIYQDNLDKKEVRILSFNQSGSLSTKLVHGGIPPAVIFLREIAINISLVTDLEPLHITLHYRPLRCFIMFSS